MTPIDIGALILQIPNWAGFLLLAWIMSKNVNRLLDIIEKQQEEIDRLKNGL